ncbi:MAG TPA: glycerophosphodiester phosphodiesterase, partial [Porphyromonadaceae bacterium]|nr:glycerophosphodiester phosphodiesterase [Porphyromonadaceae bacterium]
MNQKNVIITLLFLTFVFSATSQEIIAHRGYWKTEGSAQNSVA